MNVIKIYTDSIWYKIASKSNSHKLYRTDLDICTFRLLVIRGFLSAVIFPSIYILLYSVVSYAIFIGIQDQHDVSVLVAFLISIFCVPLLIVVGLLVVFIILSTYSFVKDGFCKNSSVLHIMYDSFKQKYCTKVEIQNRGDEL